MKALRIIANVLTGILVVILVVAVVSQVVGIRFFGVQTGSMSPEIAVGSLVVTAPESIAGAYIEGDIVSFVADSNLTVVTHRVVAVDAKAGTVTTQGDTNESPDPPILSANVVGKVVYSIPALGYIAVVFSSTPAKIIFCTILVIFAILSLFLSSLKRKSNKKHVVITYDEEEDLSPEAFAEIQQRLTQPIQPGVRNA